ncbi:hypothetical protein STRTUCAR8_01353 [Streptomyces turgidiscabies Car8]|uniref:Uncharacterized protein n=1 Tax=Streptomyces turgidiscabies (strain Car8) TaxID=698760 RepID=L7F432_STRT8|nr:hypothetical protein STRTUCAR8_01353 [Streptomyces turgidiscabies Car8]
MPLEPGACRIPLSEIGRAEAYARACAELGEPRAAVEGRWRPARRPGEAHRPRQDRFPAHTSSATGRNSGAVFKDASMGSHTV